jgi:uncharacterized membrane protein
MAKKYDTNPLDPDFPEKVREQETVILPKPDGKTRQFAEFDEREAPTRRYEQANFASHANAYSTAQPVEKYKISNLYKEDGSRKVAKVGLPENILTTLPYLPFYIGFIAGIVELFIVPKSETKVRFHAAQGLAAHLGILLITTALGIIGNITEIADVGNWIFGMVTFVMLIVWSIKAYQGKPVHIESVDDLTNWLEEKIKPQK